MSASTTPRCAACGQPLAAGTQPCGACGLPGEPVPPPGRDDPAAGAPTTVFDRPAGSWSLTGSPLPGQPGQRTATSELPAQPPPGPAPGPAAPAWAPVAPPPGWAPAGPPAPGWAPPGPPAGSGRRTWLLVAVPLAVLLVAAVVLAALLLGPDAEDDAGVGTAARPTVSGGAPAPSDTPVPAPAEVTGPLTALATAGAPVTAPGSVDGAGNRTSYEPARMLDGDPTTAWRMDGDGTGTVLTFTLDAERPVTTVGLVNGYAKVDPVTGEDRYPQSRRITRVTWTIGDTTVQQTLTDGVRSAQTIDVPAVTAGSIRLRIDAVTAPGGPTFDRTAVSEVYIANG